MQHLQTRLHTLYSFVVHAYVYSVCVDFSNILSYQILIRWRIPTFSCMLLCTSVIKIKIMTTMTTMTSLLSKNQALKTQHELLVPHNTCSFGSYPCWIKGNRSCKHLWKEELQAIRGANIATCRQLQMQLINNMFWLRWLPQDTSSLLLIPVGTEPMGTISCWAFFDTAKSKIVFRVAYINKLYNVGW